MELVQFLTNRGTELVMFGVDNSGRNWYNFLTAGRNPYFPVATNRISGNKNSAEGKAVIGMTLYSTVGGRTLRIKIMANIQRMYRYDTSSLTVGWGGGGC